MTFINIFLFFTAPSVPPPDFRYTNVSATSITFQWGNLTVGEANGIVRSFTVTCISGDLPQISVSNSIPVVISYAIIIANM